MSTRVVHVNDQVEGAVYIGRKSWQGKGLPWLKESIFANPFKIGDKIYGVDAKTTRADVIEAYRIRIQDAPNELLSRLPELRGKPLACWCRHDREAKTESNACHGDVLVSLLEQYSDEELREMATNPKENDRDRV